MLRELDLDYRSVERKPRVVGSSHRSCAFLGVVPSFEYDERSQLPGWWFLLVRRPFACPSFRPSTHLWSPVRTAGGTCGDVHFRRGRFRGTFEKLEKNTVLRYTSESTSGEKEHLGCAKLDNVPRCSLSQENGPKKCSPCLFTQDKNIEIKSSDGWNTPVALHRRASFTDRRDLNRCQNETRSALRKGYARSGVTFMSSKSKLGLRTRQGLPTVFVC